MKLATYNNRETDGTLLLVSRDLCSMANANDIAPTMLHAIRDWDSCGGRLRDRYEALNAGVYSDARPFVIADLLAPLPRAPQWLDASSFLVHGERMVKAFDMNVKESVQRRPLMYQGCPDFLPSTEDVVLPYEDHGFDFEAELAVIVDKVPMGASLAESQQAIRLLMLVDDVSLRALQPAEMSTGFGMIHSKPASVCSPVCVTPDELGTAWRDGRVHLSMEVNLNGESIGKLAGEEMDFTFQELIAHAAYTRRLSAGTIIGSGTFSNRDESRGVGCLAEKRAKEKIVSGTISTGWLRYGDRVAMRMCGPEGASIFGDIDHGYRACPSTS